MKVVSSGAENKQTSRPKRHATFSNIRNYTAAATSLAHWASPGYCPIFVVDDFWIDDFVVFVSNYFVERHSISQSPKKLFGVLREREKERARSR